MTTPLPYPDDLTYGSSFKMDARVDRVDFGDGYSERERDGINSVRQTWQLIWRGIDDAKAEALRVLFTLELGDGLLSWTPFNQPDELKWTANGFASAPAGFDTHDCQVVLTQEFDL
jgi:phage-related protein